MAYNVVFPQGTKTIFTQPSAPVGWTKLTEFGTMDVRDAAIRISSGNVSYTDGVPFETVFFNATILGNLSTSPTTPGSPTITINSTLGSTTLTEAQMPTHTHLRRVPYAFGQGELGFGVVPATNPSSAIGVKIYARIYAYPVPGPGPYTSTRYSDLTDHLTYLPPSPGYGHNHSFSATLTSMPTPINFAIKYVDCIIASKD